jgi:hypothetical protein
MANKYNKVEPKIHPITIAIISVVVLLLLALIIFTRPSKSEVIYNQYIQYETVNKEWFTEDHPFTMVNFKSGFLGFNPGLERIIEKDEYSLVYFGYAGCEACQQHVGPYQHYFFEVGLNEYLSTIHYFDVTEDLDNFQILQDQYEQIEGVTPQLILFRNGEIVLKLEMNETLTLNRNILNFFDEVLNTIK